MGETCWYPIYTYCAKKLDSSNVLSTFSFVLLAFLLILVLFHGASDINLLVELHLAGKNQRIELVKEFISALREEESLWDVTSSPWISILMRSKSSSKFSAVLLKTFLYSSSFSERNSRNRVLSNPGSFLFVNQSLTQSDRFCLHCFLPFFSSSCK